MTVRSRLTMPQMLSEPVTHIESVDSVPHSRAWTRWPKFVLFFFVFLWLMDIGISFLIRHTRLQRKRDCPTGVSIRKKCGSRAL